LENQHAQVQEKSTLQDRLYKEAKMKKHWFENNQQQGKYDD